MLKQLELYEQNMSNDQDINFEIIITYRTR